MSRNCMNVNFSVDMTIEVSCHNGWWMATVARPVGSDGDIDVGIGFGATPEAAQQEAFKEVVSRMTIDSFTRRNA